MKQTIKRVVLATLLISLAVLRARVTRAQAGVTDDEIRAILRDRIDVAKKGVGIVVGLVGGIGSSGDNNVY